MKEATGELNMTVITVVAIAAIATLFYTLVWPAIQLAIVKNTCATYGEGWEAKRQNAAEKIDLDATNATDQKYYCCKGSECVVLNN